MSRRTIHAVPVGSSRHVPSERCPCGPSPAADLLEPGTVVIVHRGMPPAWPPQREPLEARVSDAPEPTR